MTRWILLACAILGEVAGSMSLKAALGHPGWYAVTAVGFVVAFACLSGVLRRGMPLGIAYGIWGATGVALIMGGILPVETGRVHYGKDAKARRRHFHSAQGPALAAGPTRPIWPRTAGLLCSCRTLILA